MSDLMSTIGTFLSSNSGAIKGLATAAGTAGNLYSGVTNALNTNAYNSTQSYIQNLVKNPTQLAAAAAKLQQPLSAGLTDEVTNQVQGSLAERGLGGSPAAMTSAITQSLAPYIQTNQNTALQTLMQTLGLGSSTKPATLPTMDLSKLIAQLKMGGSDPTSGMVATGVDDTQTTPQLTLDTNVAPEDYASAYTG